MYRKLLTALFAASLLLPTQAQNRQKTKTINKKEAQRILEQNSLLQAKIDSLTAELDSYRAKLSEDKTGIDLQRTKPIFTAEMTDSLLGEWYLTRQAKDEEVEGDVGDKQFKSQVPDSILIKRLELMNSYINLPFNQTVKNYMILYAEKTPEKMSRLLSLSNYYFPIIEEVLARYELPLELKYMSIIESALNPVARSRVGALGMWQFMYNTGKNYGLTINSFVDERMDVEKSADAAARYLRDAYNIFGDWCLAISSYNCGAGNVYKAIRRSGGKRDFWSIYPYLPRETRGFMPAFVGAMYAMTYYREYGLRPSETTLPVATDTMHINRNLHFEQVSDIVGVPITLLKEMNPQYTHNIVPGSESTTYVLKIPYDYTSTFIEKSDTLYAHKADSLMSPKVLKSIKEGGNGSSSVYIVKSGDNLGKIAMRHGVSVANIKRWNNLSSNTIRIGQRLYLYDGGKSASSSSTVSTEPFTTGKSADGETTYKVRSGDSLYSIAKHFPGVSADDIMNYNGISTNIKPGMILRIPKP